MNQLLIRQTYLVCIVIMVILAYKLKMHEKYSHVHMPYRTLQTGGKVDKIDLFFFPSGSIKHSQVRHSEMLLQTHTNSAFDVQPPGRGCQHLAANVFP